MNALKKQSILDDMEVSSVIDSNTDELIAYEYTVTIPLNLAERFLLLIRGLQNDSEEDKSTGEVEIF